MLSRRQFVMIVAATAMSRLKLTSAAEQRRFETCGVVLYPWDLTLTDWPERAANAGITTIGLHAARRLDVLIDFVRSEKGVRFLGRCRDLGVQVEYELHAMGDLLSRELYYQDTSLFRVDSSGQRSMDFNCCPNNPRALELISQSAVAVGRILKPTTGRYFYWPDDGREWCSCSECRGLTASEQATLVENAIVTELRRQLDDQATLAHIAYLHTIEPPRKVKPHPGLFVEFAPIERSYEHSIGRRDFALNHGSSDPKTHGGYLDALDANLEVFGKHHAQVLEYWLDVSRFSRWTRPSQKVPWNPDVVAADAEVYSGRGIKHVTSFATWIDDRYLKAFGEPPLEAYGRLLQGKG